MSAAIPKSITDLALRLGKPVHEVTSMSADELRHEAERIRLEGRHYREHADELARYAAMRKAAGR